jgi:hypothetical protein
MGDIHAKNILQKIAKAKGKYELQLANGKFEQYTYFIFNKDTNLLSKFYERRKDENYKSVD